MAPGRNNHVTVDAYSMRIYSTQQERGVRAFVKPMDVRYI